MIVLPFFYSFRSVFILDTFVFTQCSPKLFVCVLVIEHSATPPPPHPSEAPVTLLIIHSSKVLLKACQKSVS